MSLSCLRGFIVIERISLSGGVAFARGILSVSKVVG